MQVKILTWLLELLVPPWGLIASFFTEPSPLLVDNLLSPYKNFVINCDQYSIASQICNSTNSSLLGSPSNLTKNR